MKVGLLVYSNASEGLYIPCHPILAPAFAEVLPAHSLDLSSSVCSFV